MWSTTETPVAGAPDLGARSSRRKIVMFPIGSPVAVTTINMSALTVSGSAARGNHSVSEPFCGITVQLHACSIPCCLTDAVTFSVRPANVSVDISRLPNSSPRQSGQPTIPDESAE